MRVDCMEVELAGDQEDDRLDGGQAGESARAALGGLEQAVDGLQEAVGLAGLRPKPRCHRGDDAPVRPPLSSPQSWSA